MEATQETHPISQQLAALALGQLAPQARERWQAHVDGCTTCREFLAQASRESLLSMLHSGAAPRPTAEQSTPAAQQRLATSAPSIRPSLVKAAPLDVAAIDSIPMALRQQTKYRIVRLLGRGGMGSVYEVYHEKMQRRQALKVINPELVDNPQALLRFEAEVKAVAKLDHPNIARAYDAESFGPLQAIVMEFVSGQTLYDFLKKRGRLSVIEACRCVRQACLGLQHAHEKGLIHRDLKPQNLMLTQDKGIVKILDFGLAKIVSENQRGRGLTRTNMTMGTYEYCAPEQAMDAASADIRADIYSLGCTIYYLIAGVLPFEHKSAATLLLAHQHETPSPLCEVRPDVPKDLSDLVARMLAKSPADRPQTPAELARALMPFAKGEIKSPAEDFNFSELPVAAIDVGLASLAAAVQKDAVGVASNSGKQILGTPLPVTPWLIWLRKSPKRIALVAGGAAALVMMVLFAVVISMRTTDGILTVEVSDPEATVQVLNAQGKIVVQQKAGAQKVEISVVPGKGKLRVEKNGVELLAKEFTMLSGGRETIYAKLEAPQGSGPRESHPSLSNTPVEIEHVNRQALETVERKRNIASPIPLAWYRFKGNAKDEMNPSGVAILRNVEYRDRALCVNGIAYSLPQGNTILLTTKPIDFKAFTVALCIKPEHLAPTTDDQANADLFKGGPNVLLAASDLYRWFILSRSNTGKLTVELNNHAFSCDFKDTAIPVDQWSNIACGVDLRAGRCVVYVNGKKAGEASVPTNLTLDNGGSTTTTWTFADYSHSWTFKGLVDEFLVYDRLLSPEEFEAIPMNRRSAEKANLDSNLSPDRHVDLGFGDSQRLTGTAPAAQSNETPANATVPVRSASIAPPIAIAPLDADKAKEYQDAWAKYLREPVVQTNSIGMRLVLIPPGEFQMGSTKELIDEESRLHGGDSWYKQHLPGECPRHRVRITTPYCLGVTAVTQKEYLRVMGNNPAKFQGDFENPVEQVSWDNAVEFCRRLSDLPEEKASNREYRLPTEAQWEYACRAGSTGPWYFSNQANSFNADLDEKLMDDYSWFNHNSGGRLHEVGGKRPSPWGLYDMYGNVWQWCQDWHDQDYYKHSTVVDPAGPSQGADHVSHGGGWDSPVWYCRSALRRHSWAWYKDGALGFRVSMIPVD